MTKTAKYQIINSETNNFLTLMIREMMNKMVISDKMMLYRLMIFLTAPVPRMMQKWIPLYAEPPLEFSTSTKVDIYSSILSSLQV